MLCSKCVKMSLQEPVCVCVRERETERGERGREGERETFLAFQKQKLSGICEFETHLVFTANSRLGGAHSHSVT